MKLVTAVKVALKNTEMIPIVIHLFCSPNCSESVLEWQE